MTTSASRRLLALALPLALATSLGAPVACSNLALGTPGSSRYEIEQRFPERFGQDVVLGVRVHSKLSHGSLSEAELKQLSSFLAEILQLRGEFGLVLDVTGGAPLGKDQLALDVFVTSFHAASEAARKNGIYSHLYGAIEVTGVDDSHLGVATIWATGNRLELIGKTEPPDTVKEFADAILELMQ